MNAAVWTLEWQQALRRRRVLLFSAGVPLMLVAAVALGGAPAPHAALVYTVLFTFFGTFGAAIPWARDAERGWIHRLRLTGVGLPVVALERLLAGALVDLIELVPSLIVIVLVYRTDLARTGWLALAVFVGVLAANAVGILVATVAASLAETALLAAVTALLLLHAGGAFRTAPAGSAAESLQRAIPFHYMHQAIKDAVRAP